MQLSDKELQHLNTLLTLLKVSFKGTRFASLDIDEAAKALENAIALLKENADARQ